MRRSVTFLAQKLLSSSSMATTWFLVDAWHDQPAPSQFENHVAVNDHQAVILHWNTGHFANNPNSADFSQCSTNEFHKFLDQRITSCQRKFQKSVRSWLHWKPAVWRDIIAQSPLALLTSWISSKLLTSELSRLNSYSWLQTQTKDLEIKRDEAKEYLSVDLCTTHAH